MSQVEDATSAGLPAYDEQPPLDGADEPAPRQLRFDGMPVVEHQLNFSGNVTISQEAARDFKAGKQIRLEVVVYVAKRTHKAMSTYGEPTGDVKHLMSCQVVGLVDEDE